MSAPGSTTATTYRWLVLASGGGDELATVSFAGSPAGAGELAIGGDDQDAAELVDFYLRQVGAAAGRPARGRFVEIDRALTGFSERFRQFEVVREGERAARFAPVRVDRTAAAPLLDVLVGEGGATLVAAEGLALAVAPDGRRLAIGDPDGAVLLCDAGSGAPIARLAGHSDAVRVLAFAADGALLVSGGSDRGACLWRVADGALVARLGDRAVSAAVIGGDGAILTGGADGVLRRWGSDGAARGERGGHDHWVAAAALAPDGQLLVTAGQDHAVRVRDAATGAVLRSWWFGPDPPRGAAFAGADCVVYLTRRRLAMLDARTGTIAWTAAIAGRRGRALAVSPDGAVVAAGTERGTVLFFEAHGGAPLGSLSAGGAVEALAFTGPRRLLTAGADGVRAWTLAGAEGQAPRREPEGRYRPGPRSRLLYARPADHPLTDAVLGPGPELVTAAGEDGTLWLLRSGDGEPRTHVAAHPAGHVAVAVAAGGARIASGGRDGVVRVWDDALAELRSVTAAGPVTCLALSADGRWLAAGGAQPAVTLWDLDVVGDRPAAELAGEGFATAALAFGPDATTLAVTDRYGAAQLWDVVHDLRRDDPEGPDRLTAVAACAGRLVLAGSAAGLALAEAAGLHAGTDPALVRCLERRRGNDLLRAAVAPGGRLAAVVFSAGTIGLIDIASEGLLALLGASGELAAAAFLPDGRHLITAGAELRLWRIELGDEAAGQA